MMAQLAARLRRGLPALVAAAALLLACRPASAGLVISATNVPAAQPSSGNNFDVLLTNNNASGGASYTVGTFVFEVMIGNAQINMTNATGLTDGSYMFAGNSFDGSNGLPLLVATAGQDLSAADTATPAGRS
jgi:hypothetical protein